MSEEMNFFIFLVEQYAAYKNTSADIILKKWDSIGITDIILNSYELYHIEALENAFKDIIKLEEEHS